MGARYFPWMAALAGLFVLRVLAQLIQAIYPITLLPPFDAWHGAVLRYPVLAGFQVVIIVGLAWILWGVRTDSIVPHRWKYRVCLVAGGTYFVFMLFRLAAGLTIFADIPWFSRSLPALFHLVLATFLLMLGHYIRSRAVMPASRSRPGQALEADRRG